MSNSGWEHDDRTGQFEKMILFDKKTGRTQEVEMTGYRFVRVGIVLLALLAALSIGFVTPVLAAPPAQTSEPPTADALAAAIVILVGLVITFVSGGGISVVLEMFPQWTAWQSPAKGYIIIALSILLVAALTSAKVLTTPAALAGLPEWAIAFIGSIVFSLTALFGTQITYKRFLK